MDLTDILIGIVFALIFWKLLKFTFRTFFWVLVIGLAAAFLLPEQFPWIGDLGVTVLSFLGSLLVLTVAGFFFFTGD